MSGRTARSLAVILIAVVALSVLLTRGEGQVVPTRSETFTRAESRLERRLEARRREVVAYRAFVWDCQDRLGERRSIAADGAWSIPRSLGYRVWAVRLWKARYRGCSKALESRVRENDWRQWLPDKWRRVGVCETGLNWHHANSSFISAFGISRQAYDQDAAVMGAAAWSDVRHPSPWQQFQAALGHYKLHGGFSGWGCRGA